MRREVRCPATLAAASGLCFPADIASQCHLVHHSRQKYTRDDAPITITTLHLGNCKGVGQPANLQYKTKVVVRRLARHTIPVRLQDGWDGQLGAVHRSALAVVARTSDFHRAQGKWEVPVHSPAQNTQEQHVLQQ